jgi:predicted nucleic acid-binding protein
LEKGYLLYTVETALAECLNVIWKHAILLKDLSVEDTTTATQYLLQTFVRLNIAKTTDLAEQTMAIAQTLKIPVYDALYIALAKKKRGLLYTTDKKLSSTAEKIVTIKLLKPN